MKRTRAKAPPVAEALNLAVNGLIVGDYKLKRTKDQKIGVYYNNKLKRRCINTYEATPEGLEAAKGWCTTATKLNAASAKV